MMHELLDFTTVNDDEHMFALLLDYVVLTEDEINQLLIKACKRKAIEIVKYLMKNERIDMTANNNAALKAAMAIKDNHDVVLEIIWHTNDISGIEFADFFNACKYGYNDVILQLLRKTSHISKKNLAELFCIYIGYNNHGIHKNMQF